MAKVPENFTDAVYFDGTGVFRSVQFTKSRLIIERDCQGNLIEGVDRRPMYEVCLDPDDRAAREALEEATGGRWCPRNKCWMVWPERVRDLVSWVEEFMAGGAWTDAETSPKWRGIIGDAPPVQPFQLAGDS